MSKFKDIVSMPIFLLFVFSIGCTIGYLVGKDRKFMEIADCSDSGILESIGGEVAYISSEEIMRLYSICDGLHPIEVDGCKATISKFLNKIYER